MRRLLPLLAIAAVAFAQRRPFDAYALMELQRIGDPQISPDGQTVAFQVQSVDVEANRKPVQVWTVPLNGGAARQITHDGEQNQRPRWSPDSKRIAYISDRGGSSQIWLMDPDGGNPRQITSLSTEADGVTFSPDGKNLLFTSQVYPECGADEACNQKNLDAEYSSKVKARIYTDLLYRHWNQWQGKRRSHLLVVPATGGAPKDLTPGPRDVPGFSLGGPDDYDISPDGQEVCYSMNADPVPAVSTNSDLYVVSIAGGPARKITITAGADAGPHYSPDGKYIAWRAQTRAGYESDRWRLLVLERGTGRVTNLTDNLDRWVNSFTWAPESTGLFFTTGDRGRQAIQLIPISGGAVRSVASGDGELDDMQLTRNGKTMVYTQQTGVSPVEIFRASSGGGVPVALTHLNDQTLGNYQMTALEEFMVDGAEGAKVQSFVVKPYGFNPTRKYPVLMLIHGGPQGFWGHSWTYRWNAQVFAAAGYVVVMPNPRGSTGYGQRFIDDINNDWGGRAFDDIMAVADHVVNQMPYCDAGRMAAAGGSYGGYMIDWILGHTQRFKALVSHDGVYDLTGEFGGTEELWFPLWEYGGNPWDKPENYARWSPNNFVKDFHTPTLVIHGEQDFRIPYSQALELFTALQLQKVPSKLLLFPDEGHWVLKPQNSLLWYKTFLEWIDSWVKK
ncbi:MAG TPA: S9 family peptidase [Candidatus Acidoferrales bacterium]|jgi:dipeptidyl aminopeptidase/acylaminoacyl peptidase|nr:S9 family peptidase [Candidatus Acidoferrales bacterium]